MRKFLPLAFVALLALLVPAAPVALASAHRPTGPAPIQENSPSNCQTIGISHGWVGNLNYSHQANYQVLGAQADVFANLNECVDTTGTDDANSASAWVGVQENYPSVGNRIVQMGIMRCHDDTAPTDSPCYGANAGHYRFWTAWGRENGDCGLGTHIPRPVDLGIADAIAGQTYTLTVKYVADNWHFYINNISEKVIPDTECWTTDSNPNQAVYSGERWDAADAIGTASSNSVKYARELRFEATSPTASGSWYTNTIQSCVKAGDQSYEFNCAYLIGSSSINTWTVLQ